MAASDFFSRWAKKPDGGETPARADPTLASGQSVAPTPPMSQTGPAEPPTVEQARQLTPEDDFRAFVQPRVSPEVRNTALRQLFSDPHFNVMDGLDIYIDDYSKPDPLAVGDLARMASAHALRLLKSEPDVADAAPLTRGAAPAEPNTETPSDDADLRLQPNPTPGPAGDGPGAD